MKKLIAALFAAVVLALIFGAHTQTARAQDNGGGQPPLPPYLTVGADGKIDFNASGLTPGEPMVMDPPPGFPKIEGGIPGTDLTACAGCLVYNTYTTADGATVVIPNAYTAVVMAASGYSPFNAQPDFAMGNGILQIAAMQGVFEGMGIPAEQMTPETLAARLDPRSSEFDPFFMLQLNAALNDPNSPLNTGSFFFAAGIFQFSCHPVTGECTDSNPNDADKNGQNNQCPDGMICQPCPPGQLCPPQPNCPAGMLCQTPGDFCPRNLTVTAPPPVYTALKVLPEYPVVVGQDPAKRGVDMHAGVTVPPVNVQYNVEKEYRGDRVCKWFSGTGHGGCGGGYDRLDSPTGHWYNDGHWDVEQETRKVCERVTETYPDPVSIFTVQMRLDDASIAWIETGDLQLRYPGAHVYQADWPLWPEMPPTLTNISADGASILLEWDKLPLRDPGQYHVIIGGQTQGTPYTTPRLLKFDEITFDVAVFITALTK